jgi:hypothetical protein
LDVKTLHLYFTTLIMVGTAICTALIVVFLTWFNVTEEVSHRYYNSAVVLLACLFFNFNFADMTMVIKLWHLTNKLELIKAGKNDDGSLHKKTLLICFVLGFFNCTMVIGIILQYWHKPPTQSTAVRVLIG